MSSIKDSSPAHWEAYWNAAGGRRAAVSGDAPGDLFDETWRRFLTAALAERGPAPSLLDLACGAGVLLDRALETVAAFPDLQARFIGLDYAVSAAAAVARKPAPERASVAGVAASAAALPFEDGAFGIVVSQFGVEYARMEAFSEAARVLAPGGVMQLVIHYKGGGIDMECSENVRVLQGVLRSGLFEIAAEAVRGPDHDGAIAKLKSVFAELRPLLDGDRVAAKEMLARLLGDVSQLVSRRQAYDPREAEGWCAAMRGEVALYEGRMRAMTESALDSAGIEAARERLAAQGATAPAPEALTPKGKALPAAWLLKAERSS
ncbi:class I SAM-dependent methyltransferase [Hyphococcus sp.]|uniref:class I SAM-dependent methyltransferase n=1 Tax=Hyphococcus sp. TaxID=2038636 RepID=UPI003D11BC89